MRRVPRPWLRLRGDALALGSEDGTVRARVDGAWHAVHVPGELNRVEWTVDGTTLVFTDGSREGPWLWDAQRGARRLPLARDEHAEYLASRFGVDNVIATAKDGRLSVHDLDGAHRFSATLWSYPMIAHTIVPHGDDRWAVLMRNRSDPNDHLTVIDPRALAADPDHGWRAAEYGTFSWDLGVGAAGGNLIALYQDHDGQEDPDDDPDLLLGFTGVAMIDLPSKSVTHRYPGPAGLGSGATVWADDRILRVEGCARAIEIARDTAALTEHRGRATALDRATGTIAVWTDAPAIELIAITGARTVVELP